MYVASGWQALRDAVCLKKKGKITKLITGPVGECADDYGGLILDGAIDVCVVPCRWYKEQCERDARAKGLRWNNIKVWPVGVDHEKWKPDRAAFDARLLRALVYVKGRGAAMEERTVRALEQSGKEVRRIYCGSHVPEDYKILLEWCDFVVYLGYSETQGLALAQAWSMNRPTFVYEPESLTTLGLEAAPYLTDATGMRWRCIDELSPLLRSSPSYEPRKWVLANQTNAIAFGNFLKIVEGIK